MFVNESFLGTPVFQMQMPSPTAKTTVESSMLTVQSSRACQFYRFAEGQVALMQNSDTQLINSLPPGGQMLHPHQKQIKHRLPGLFCLA